MAGPLSQQMYAVILRICVGMVGICKNKPQQGYALPTDVTKLKILPSYQVLVYILAATGALITIGVFNVGLLLYVASTWCSN